MVFFNISAQDIVRKEQLLTDRIMHRLAHFKEFVSHLQSRVRKTDAFVIERYDPLVINTFALLREMVNLIRVTPTDMSSIVRKSNEIRTHFNTIRKYVREIIVEEGAEINLLKPSEEELKTMESMELNLISYTRGLKKIPESKKLFNNLYPDELKQEFKQGFTDLSKCEKKFDEMVSDIRALFDAIQDVRVYIDIEIGYIDRIFEQHDVKVYRGEGTQKRIDRLEAKLSLVREKIEAEDSRILGDINFIAATIARVEEKLENERTRMRAAG